MIALFLAAQLVAPWTAMAQQDDPALALLEDSKAAVRAKGAEICGIKGITKAVVKLIDLTADESADVKAAAVTALKQITGLELQDTVAWKEWLKSEDGRKYVDATKGQNLGAVWARLDTLKNQMDAYSKDLEDRTKGARLEQRYLVGAMTLIGVLFMLIMFYFVGHVSSRLKEWKELVGRGEVTIKKGEEITHRTDRIIAELDAKRAEIMAFFDKVKDDNRVEFERYCEMLQKNLEHQVREQVMIYRQKAEKELEQTLADFMKRNRITT